MANTQPQPTVSVRPDGLTDKEWARIQSGRKRHAAIGKPVGFVRDRSDRVKTRVTNWREERKLNNANNPQQKFSWGAFGAAVLAAFIIVGLLGSAFHDMSASSRFQSLEQQIADIPQTVQNEVDKAKAEITSAKDKEIADAKAAADAAQKKSDELAAEKTAALNDKDKIAADKAAVEAELAKARNATFVAPPAPAPAAPNAQSDVDRQLADKGYSAANGWTRNLDAAAWADIANNNPGNLVVGTSLAKTPEEAAAAAKNNPTVAGSFEQKADPKNWVLVYNKQCMTYDAMAYQLPNGTFAWGGGFTECGVGIWVNLASGGQFRLLCDNGVQQAPVVTNLPPSLPEVTPNVKLTPPTGKTVVVHTPPKEEKPPVKAPEKMKVCIKDSGDQTLVEINKSDFNPAIHSTNVEDCKKPVVVTCPEGQVPNTETENPNDCLVIKDPANNPELPVDHDPAPAPTEDQVTPDPDTTPLPNPIDPELPVEAPASPVVTAPGADPVPNPAPVPAPEQPAPTPEQPGQVFTDPDNAVAAPAAAVVAPAPAAAPVVSAEAPAVVKAPTPVVPAAPVVNAPAPTVPTEAPADVVTQVASVDATNTVG